ncbi:Peptidyl-tRNA hydrolase [wastewater metagenome]|uniref:peptidyl-tRNA hydrolase n=2 Tax=unclassified sequences TaxID=12908 RepID=A0A5B8R9C6_9ZZZZ|nr:aminoacyl-tRNA hydrolase [Arhodomonas sp. KWT]QEA03912.1 peptidyl-tRNA hydrolase [uncultured organism]
MAGGDARIRCIVGLGNPGPRYERTRHNAGFWFVDELARRHGGQLRAARRFHGEHARVFVDGVDVHLLKPTTYMNHSGRAVQALARFYDIDAASMLVAHDEIDLPPGTVRLKRDGGHGGHNGLRDIIKALGARDFARLRLGVGHPGSADQVIPYVLSNAGRDEQAAIDGAIDEAASVLPWLLAGDWDRAFQRLHTAA